MVSQNFRGFPDGPRRVIIKHGRSTNNDEVIVGCRNSCGWIRAECGSPKFDTETKQAGHAGRTKSRTSVASETSHAGSAKSQASGARQPGRSGGAKSRKLVL